MTTCANDLPSIANDMAVVDTPAAPECRGK
jgi:hypothetical protein